MARSKTPSKSKSEFDADTIREAYEAGKKTVVLDGVEMKIKKRVRKVVFYLGENPKAIKREEGWLVVTPKNPLRMFPRIQIEVKDMGNLRSI